MHTAKDAALASPPRRDARIAPSQRRSEPAVGAPHGLTPGPYLPDAPSEGRYRGPLVPSEDRPRCTTALAFSSDSKWLASGEKDGKIILWETVPFGATAKQTTESAVGALAFSPDGQSLASVHKCGDVEVWSIEHSGLDGRVHLNLWRNRPCPRPAPLLAVSWYPDGTRIAMCSKEGAVYFLNPWQNISTVVLRDRAFDCPPAGTLTFARFSPDTSLIALGFSREKRSCELRKVATGKLHTTIPGHILNAQFNASGTLIATCDGDKAVRIRNTLSGFPEWSQFNTLPSRTNAALDAALSPDGEYVLVAERNGPVRLWRIPPSKSPPSTEPCLSIDDGEVTCITSLFSPDGKHIAHIKDDGRFSLRPFVRVPAESSDGAGTRYDRV